MSNIKFSVITIVYNDYKNIEKTILSVINQTYKNIEYIIIDGASTDGSIDVINKYQDKISKIISEPDSGIYNAMNKGIYNSSGDYIIFMNSGDKFSADNIIESIVNNINCSMLPNIIYGNYRESNNGICSNVIPAWNYKRIWYGVYACHQSMFYNLKLIKDNKLQFDESYKIAADYKFDLEITILAKENILKLDLCISDFDISGISNTNQNKCLRETNKARREVLKMNYIKIYAISAIQILARCTKKYLNPLYKLIRKIK